MNELIEDYQRKVNSVNELLKDKEDYDDETINRLKIKVGCYRSFLTDLKRALNIDLVSKSACATKECKFNKDNECIRMDLYNECIHKAVC